MEKRGNIEKKCVGPLTRALLLVALLTGGWPARAQQTDKFLEQLLKKNPELFGKVLDNPAKYDVQILYTQINRDEKNRPLFKTYRYRLNKDRYFYPASTVKLPTVLLALEKINQLRKKQPDLSIETPMFTDSTSYQIGVRRDSTAETGLPSVAQYIRKILLVSDNDAFNRLYEFIGPCELNERLREKGYKNTRITHRLSISLTPDQNRRTNAVRFVRGDTVLYGQPEQVCEKLFRPDRPIRRGVGYLKGGTLVKEPFDFTEKNFFSLEDQQDMLRAVLFPDEVPARNKFDLTADDYRFLYRYLSQWPRETKFPKYDSTYYDSYGKFLVFGDARSRIPASVRIFNKAGDAYGYMIDNAYIVDFEKNIEFLLSAVIYCNEDGIFNDNRYDYQTVGHPFMANLGRVLFDYEVTRKRLNPPDLSRFRVKYDD
ncbi:serine hydrolase [Larkinella insperata]|uniref:Serine hydrolase n=1 Tax=Larkinella insperata TaxID=332158 RepID=A0ABW3Q8F8_9BACT|nr:serine hydrolase [Larkinella insperata]